ncbi:MAG TPA: plastocyanin/azurin family copper-binding protein [Actinomycetota bacterium]|jgi:plastocyanin|nr:plastocyanin/azurin family copper-binding protein [Actinomycetota bacterium]
MSAKVAIVLVGALLVAAAPAGGATVRIRATDDDRWDPARRKVARGTTVVWRNPTDAVHDVEIWKSPVGRIVVDDLLEPGETAKRRLRKKGVYKYRCRVHSAVFRENGKRVCRGMCGTVRAGAS